MKNSKIPLLFVVSFLLASVNIFASDLFTYQGKLTTETGNAVSDGQYRIGVRIWDVATGGTEPLWARKYDVPVQNGVFFLMIGAEGLPWGIVGETGGPLTDSIKLAVSGTDRFLEITVMSEADGPELDSAQWKVLQPRQRLNAVPYAMNGVPPGTVVPFAGVVVPEGWVRCDGSSYPTDDARYTALHEAIQGVYGTGDGTFVVPDLRGRAPIGNGKGDTWMPGGVDQSTNWLLGQKFGAEKHQLSVSEMPSHNHGVNDPGHTHNNSLHDKPEVYVPSGYAHNGNVGHGYSGVSIAHIKTTKTGVTIKNKGDNQPHNNMQPSLVLNYIIKL